MTKKTGIAVFCSLWLLDITAHTSLLIFKYQQQKHLDQSSVLKSSSIKRKFQKEIITGRAKRGKYTLYCCKSKAVSMPLACFPLSGEKKKDDGIKENAKSLTRPKTNKQTNNKTKTKKQHQQEQKAANR